MSERILFTDLVRDLPTPEESDWRKVVDAQTETATSVDSFLKNWANIHFDLTNEVSFSGSYRELLPKAEYQASPEVDRYECQLEVKYKGQPGLKLRFSVRETPHIPNVTDSPISLYNTKVTDLKLPDFKPFSYYDTIMYMIKHIVPAHTRLTLFVRQHDSRKMLDEGGDPEQVPLTKVFHKAGWTYKSYHFDKKLPDLQKHKLIIET